MDDKMRAAALAGKTIMFRVELMPVEAKAEFHIRVGCQHRAKAAVAQVP
jgi:FKBP-type peptidyl-prolyl cis-trans isomerase 2